MLLSVSKGNLALNHTLPILNGSAPALVMDL
jgi:hypothetical protein